MSLSRFTPDQWADISRWKQEGATYSAIVGRVLEKFRINITLDALKNQFYRRAANAPEIPTTARLPEPLPEAGGASLPEPWAKPLAHLQVNDVGTWLVLGDVHLPMHDKTTLELAAAAAKQANVCGILLNGDVMDMAGISPFRRRPDRTRLVDELAMGVQFLEWLRSKFPKTRIIYREGNHELRLQNYIIDMAPALDGLTGVTVRHNLELDRLGVEWVEGKAKVMLGKLTTLHGHEFRKGTGINPARLAFLRGTASVLVGHHHRPSEHHQRTLDDKEIICWSHGCACWCHPDYDPYNQWGLGFCFVEVFSDGRFSVSNKKVIGGKVV